MRSRARNNNRTFRQFLSRDGNHQSVMTDSEIRDILVKKQREIRLSYKEMNSIENKIYKTSYILFFSIYSYSVLSLTDKNSISSLKSDFSELGVRAFIFSSGLLMSYAVGTLAKKAFSTCVTLNQDARPSFFSRFTPSFSTSPFRHPSMRLSEPDELKEIVIERNEEECSLTDNDNDEEEKHHSPSPSIKLNKRGE